MPLLIAPLETDLRILKVLVDGATKKHLESLGIVVDSHLKLLAKTKTGVIVLIKDGRLALDSNIAGHILVVA